MTALPSLSLYRPDSAPPLDASTMRLGEAFREFLQPAIAGKCSASHISRFGTAIKHWERVTDDPPVAAIDDLCLQEFVDRLLAWHRIRGYRGNENVRKILSYVTAILRACCRRGERNRRGRIGGKHLIEDLPLADPPANDRRKKRIADAEEVSKAYEACEVAIWPRSRRRTLWDNPVALWRLLFVLDFYYGPRTEDLLGLCWEDVRWEAECPAAEISRLEWPFGWLVYLPAKTRRHKPQALHLPLTECARLHLDALRPGLAPTGPIFAFPVNKRDLHGTRKNIWREAGIETPYTFQELRKTCSVNWSDHWPRLGEHVTGHAARGVNAIYYDAELRRLCRFANQLAEPSAMRRAVGLPIRGPAASAREVLAARAAVCSEADAELVLGLLDRLG